MPKHYRWFFIKLALFLGGLGCVFELGKPDVIAAEDPGVMALRLLKTAEASAQMGDDATALIWAQQSYKKAPLRQNLLAMAQAQSELGDFAAAQRHWQQARLLPAYFGAEAKAQAYTEVRGAMLQGRYVTALLAWRQAFPLGQQTEPDLGDRLRILAATAYLAECTQPHNVLQQLPFERLLNCLALPATDPSLRRVIFELGARQRAAAVPRLKPLLAQESTAAAARLALSRLTPYIRQ